jgi:hypothetical protein
MLDSLGDKLFYLFDTIKDFLYRLVLTIYDIQKDLFLWIFEQVSTGVIYLVDGLGYLFDGLNITQYISAIPPQTAYIMNLIGFGEAMGMIITSLTIRMLLQLIPFTRLGS